MRARAHTHTHTHRGGNKCRKCSRCPTSPSQYTFSHDMLKRKREERKKQRQGERDGERKTKRQTKIFSQRERHKSKQTKSGRQRHRERQKTQSGRHIHKVSKSVSWCFEPSQPLGITSGLKTSFNPSLS